MAPTLDDGTPELSNLYKNSNASYQEPYTRKTAGVWGYIFQIIFQVIFFFFLILLEYISFCALHLF